MRAAILGLGDAGSRYAADLAAAGWRVRAFDPAPVQTPQGAHRAASAAEAATDCDMVVALTGASAAVAAAQAAAVAVSPGGCYADFNSASAGLKRSVETVLTNVNRGIAMADVAVLAPVGRLGAASPLLVSGPGAAGVADAFGGLGAQVEVLDAPVGAAAGRKLLRSVFMKGLAAAALESVAAARAADCEQWLRAQIAAELGPEGDVQLDRLLEGSARHAARRIGEIEASRDYLAELGVQSLVCDASLGWLRALQEGPAGSAAATRQPPCSP